MLQFVSPSHNQGKLDGPEANEKVNQVNKRMAALLLQFNKLSAKREEEDILGLPELKVPDVIAGPYSAHSKKYKQEEDVSPLMREAKKLQKVCIFQLCLHDFMKLPFSNTVECSSNL